MSRGSFKPLAGASVLVTRPVGQGRALARQVRVSDGQPILLPGVALRAEPASVRTGLCKALADDMVIFTSPAAVRFAARLMRLHGRARIACVGTGTARMLMHHGADDVIVPTTTQDSVGLLAHPALADVHGRRIAVVGAPDGRGTLQRGLRERGAALREVHVYRRVPARLDRRHREALRRMQGRAFILLSSVETLHCLQAALAGDDWRRVLTTHAVVSSERIATAARRAGFEHVSVAVSAWGADMLERVAELNVAARGRLWRQVCNPG